MRNDQQRGLDSLIRSQDFFDKNGLAIGPVATSASKQQIDDAVSQIRTHVTSQGATTRAIAGQTDPDGIELAPRSECLQTPWTAGYETD